MNKNNKSGQTGVYFDVTSKKWRAQISVWGKKIKLGTFQTIEAATEARRAAKEEYDLTKFTYGNPFDLAIVHFALQHELHISRSDMSYNLIYSTFGIPSLIYAFLTFQGPSSFIHYAIRLIVADYKARRVRYVQNPYVSEILPSAEDKVILTKFLCGMPLEKLAKEHLMSYATAYRRVENCKNYIKVLES